MAGQSQSSAIFGKNRSFTILRADIAKTIKDSDMGFSRACSLDNSLQDDMHFKASAPLLSPHIAWEAERSRLPSGGGGGRPGAMGSEVHCCLYYYENDAPESETDIRFEFRTRNPYKHTNCR